MDLQALKQALVGACADQGLSLYNDVPNSPELPCLYCGMPSSMYDWSSAGQCTLDITLTLCVSRADEDTAQSQLSGFISTLQIPNAVMNATAIHWSGVAFTNIDNIRAASFGETTQVLACDFNFQLRTKNGAVTRHVSNTTQGQPDDGSDGPGGRGHLGVGDPVDDPAVA